MKNGLILIGGEIVHELPMRPFHTWVWTTDGYGLGGRSCRPVRYVRKPHSGYEEYRRNQRGNQSLNRRLSMHKENVMIHLLQERLVRSASRLLYVFLIDGIMVLRSVGVRTLAAAVNGSLILYDGVFDRARQAVGTAARQRKGGNEEKDEQASERGRNVIGTDHGVVTISVLLLRVCLDTNT